LQLNDESLAIWLLLIQEKVMRRGFYKGFIACTLTLLGKEWDFFLNGGQCNNDS